MAKTHVFLVKPIVPAGDNSQDGWQSRLIRGTLREVEAKLRQEVSIEPCTAEQAHQMADVEIEEAHAE